MLTPFCLELSSLFLPWVDCLRKADGRINLFLRARLNVHSLATCDLISCEIDAFSALMQRFHLRDVLLRLSKTLRSCFECVFNLPQVGREFPHFPCRRYVKLHV